jgi:GTP-binding protein Era
MSAIADSDVVLYLIDVTAKESALDLKCAREMLPSGAPAILLLNKIDEIKSKAHMLPLMEKWSATGAFREIIPISAATGEGLETLKALLVPLLPESEALFPTDSWSDMPEKFFAAEIVRGSVFRNLRQELPYSSAVEVDVFREEERGDGNGTMISITATIHVERVSQKGMVIGKGGAMLKKIGIGAREKLERFFNAKVFLELHVVVTRDWTRNNSELKKLGYFVRES